MAAARSFTIIFENMTDQTLTRDNYNLAHGIWSTDDAPPAQIGAGETTSWGSESDGTFTGTQGFASYHIGSDGAAQVFFNWDNPYWGSNASSVTCPPEYVANCTGGSGKIACLTVTFLRAS